MSKKGGDGPWPFAASLGIELLVAEAAEVRARLGWREDLFTGGGMLHGGVMIARAITARLVREAAAAGVGTVFLVPANAIHNWAPQLVVHDAVDLGAPLAASSARSLCSEDKNIG